MVARAIAGVLVAMLLAACSGPTPPPSPTFLQAHPAEATQTRVRELSILATAAAPPSVPANGAPRGAPSGVVPPTINPTAAVFATALAERNTATRTARRDAGCAWVQQEYAKYGVTFVPRPDPDGIWLELLALAGAPASSRGGSIAQTAVATQKQYVIDCVGP